MAEDTQEAELTMVITSPTAEVRVEVEEQLAEQHLLRQYLQD
jgi:hypothetical protein